jgi:hypothetical protein
MDHPDDLRERAERYRQLASQVTDRLAEAALTELADEYDALADRLEGRTEDHAGRTDGQDA